MTESANEDRPGTESVEGREENYYPSTIRVIVWVCLTGLLFFVRIFGTQIGDWFPVIEMWVRNIITLVLFVTNVFSVVGWFCFETDWWNRTLRISGFLSVLFLHLATGVFAFFFIEFDGHLNPVGWRTPSEADSKPLDTDSNQLADLTTETPDDFPQFFGPQRNGVLPNTILDRDWDENPPRQIGENKPVGAGHSAFSTRNGFAVTMEQRGDIEYTSCYRIPSLEFVWAHAESAKHYSRLGKLGPRSTPTISNGKVYSLGGSGILLCLNGNGNVVWRKDLLEEFNSSPSIEKQVVKWGRSASPLVFEDKVIVSAGGPASSPVSLVAYNRNTGEEIWRSGKTQIGYASPVVMYLEDGGITQPVILSVNESNITAHNVDNGDILWTFDLPGSSTGQANTSQPFQISGTRILVTKGYGTGAKMLEVNLQGARVVWAKNNVLKTKLTSAVCKGNYAYGLSDGRLECVNLENGSKIWASSKNYGHGQVLLCGNDLIVLSEKGKLLLVPIADIHNNGETAPRKSFSEIGKFQALNGTTWNTIAVHGKYLLIRNSREAACFELKLKDNG